MWAALKFYKRSGAIFALVVSANPKCACYVVLKLVWSIQLFLQGGRVFVHFEQQI